MPASISLMSPLRFDERLLLPSKMAMMVRCAGMTGSGAGESESLLQAAIDNSKAVRIVDS